MTEEYALLLENAVVEGRTIYKVYTSDKEFHADAAQFAGLHTWYRVSILAEEEAQRFLKKHLSFLDKHHISHDPAEVAVVSYTKIEKKYYSTN